MRARDIKAGRAYTVQVPHTLPGQRYPLDPRTRESVRAHLRLHALRGHRLALTVTAVDGSLVTGFRVTSTPYVDNLELLPEQTDALGLPVGTRYFVRGTLHDVDDQPVELPYAETLTVPARWLRPLGEPVPLPRPASEIRNRIRAQAAGMTVAQVTTKAAEFQERIDRLQSIDEPTYGSEMLLRADELERNEWIRISAVMDTQDMITYSPEHDIESGESESENE
ncbi:hypothetical protein ACFY2W_36030 [Streptomyces sp. NPDC001262]|uniref:hypothetical protein n=1 Tax=Streptomyces sp. NPDC001262 TaxID=3364552 RepID=UPI0036A22147